MGQVFRFTCPACEYTEEVSGGRDRGFFSRTTTIACKQCTRLYDVLVGTGESKDMLQDTKWTDVPARCPKSAEHQWTEWQGPGACPKCGTTMGAEGPIMMWD